MDRFHDFFCIKCNANHTAFLENNIKEESNLIIVNFLVNEKVK